MGFGFVWGFFIQGGPGYLFTFVSGCSIPYNNKSVLQFVVVETENYMTWPTFLTGVSNAADRILFIAVDDLILALRDQMSLFIMNSDKLFQTLQYFLKLHFEFT